MGRGRRPYVLWDGLCRSVLPGRHLRGQDPQGRETRRAPGGAAHAVRTGDQYEDRQGPRHHIPPDHPHPRRGGDPMSRRTLVTAVLLLAAAAGCPPVDAAQAPKIAKIGLLNPSTPAAAAHLTEAFRQGLRELGYVEGKTFVLETRYGEARAERLPELARELVGLKMDVIAAVAQQTQTIPIVMAISTDPVGARLVASLARPGGNVTGFSTMSPELSGKRLELLREAVPGP